MYINTLQLVYYNLILHISWIKRCMYSTYRTDQYLVLAAAVDTYNIDTIYTQSESKYINVAIVNKGKFVY